MKLKYGPFYMMENLTIHIYLDIYLVLYQKKKNPRAIQVDDDKYTLLRSARRSEEEEGVKKSEEKEGVKRREE